MSVFRIGAAYGNDLAAQEGAALRAAARRVSPAVVRIETLGGADEGDASQASATRSSGVVVDADGWIVASSAAFAGDPKTVLVTLADGKRLAARRVATDESRQIVLLKVDATKLPVPEAAPRGKIAVGQWAIALGRTFDGADASMSVGVVSAVDRLWNRAIQTDAKISPQNYGGPLVDVRGRVIGLITEIPLDGAGMSEGGQWYDAGIGFAVPWDHVVAVWPRLAKGENLKPGRLGISLQNADLFSKPAVIGATQAASPARKAGLKAGDRITAIDGEPVERGAQLKQQLGGQYAGDRVRITVDREGAASEHEVELVAELPAYVRPSLGLLPRRDAADVVVRHVLAGGAADTAGMTAGDKIVKLGEAEIHSRQDAAAALAERAPGETIAVTFERGGATQTVDVVLGRVDEAIPGALPPARVGLGDGEKPELALGVVPIKLPEFAESAVAYVPEKFEGRAPLGLVVWTKAASGEQNDKLIERWKAVCDDSELMLLVVRSRQQAVWEPAEAEFVRRAMEHVAEKYGVDRSRVACFGEGTDGAFALRLALAMRGRVAAAAVVEAALPANLDVPATEPLAPLAFYSAAASDSRQARKIDAGLTRLRTLEYPVSTKTLPAATTTLSADDLFELGRWLDALDRL
ncbi:MAG: PDZ domain-containing protein [Pirellulales bacterium]